jgi:hypothetical protein
LQLFSCLIVFFSVFEVLFKIKELTNKAVYNDSLSLLQKCFSNFNSLDVNKFLVQFWNCDVFKDRELGPIGYSFTEGRARYDFTGTAPNNNDIVTINAKAVDAAWSMVLDVEATINSMLNTYMVDKPMSVFYLIILRRFKCLGDYKVKLDGKETPIFLYFLRKLIAPLEGHQLNIALSCLVSVCWSPKGHYCYSAMKPNYALCEIMSHLILDDANHVPYMLALRRLFTPIQNFRCDIEWSSESKDYDNQNLFLFHFIKYYNRKQSIEKNNEVFFIISCFKTSLQHFGKKIDSFGALEDSVEVDWPFAYHVMNFLNVQGVKRQIPESIFSALPEAELDKYLSLDESVPSLQKALTGLTELYFLCDRDYRIPEFNIVLKCNYQIPDAFYKNLWNTHPHPKSVIDLFGRSIIQAYKNLKSSVHIVIDKRFIDFVSRISQFCLDYGLVESFSSATELNFDFVTRSNHLIIVGRTLRLIIEDEHAKNGRKPSCRDLPDIFYDLFKVFSMKTRDKFADIRTVNQGLWAPWRKGALPSIDDDKSMAINHILNGIQKEAFCMFDGTFAHTTELLDFLLFLHKQRKYNGLYYPRLEEALRETYPYFFQNEHSTGVAQRQPLRQDQDLGPQQRYQSNQPDQDYGAQQNGRSGSTQNRGYQPNPRGSSQDCGHQPIQRSGIQPIPSGRGSQDRGYQPTQNGHGGGTQNRSGYPLNPRGISQDRGRQSTQNGRGGGIPARGRGNGFGTHPITDNPNPRGARVVRGTRQPRGNGSNDASVD